MDGDTFPCKYINLLIVITNNYGINVLVSNVYV